MIQALLGETTGRQLRNRPSCLPKQASGLNRRRGAAETEPSPISMSRVSLAHDEFPGCPAYWKPSCSVVEVGLGPVEMHESCTPPLSNELLSKFKF